MIFSVVAGGTKRSFYLYQREGKPYLVNPTADQLRAWQIKHTIRVINVTGSWGDSLSTEQLEQYRQVLLDALW